MQDAGRREADKGAVAVAAAATRQASRTLWDWIERHSIDALTVLVVTLGLTLRIVDWAIDFSYAEVPGTSGAERAAILAAVLTPWGLTQAAMVKWYMELKTNRKGLQT